MVIGVEADIVEIVMLTTGADALLRVRRASGRVGAFGLAEKNRDELVHASVREQQVRRVGHERTRRDNGVRPRLEEVEERLADLRAGHHLKRVKSLAKPATLGELEVLTAWLLQKCFKAIMDKSGN